MVRIWMGKKQPENMHLGRYCDVFLDGVKQDFVIGACEKTGAVFKYAIRNDHRDRPIKEVLLGHVEIKLQPEIEKDLKEAGLAGAKAGKALRKSLMGFGYGLHGLGDAANKAAASLIRFKIEWQKDMEALHNSGGLAEQEYRKKIAANNQRILNSLQGRL